MEDRIIRLEQENNALRRNIQALERKMKDIEMNIRKLERIAQQKRQRTVR